MIVLLGSPLGTVQALASNLCFLSFLCYGFLDIDVDAFLYLLGGEIGIQLDFIFFLIVLEDAFELFQVLNFVFSNSFCCNLSMLDKSSNLIILFSQNLFLSHFIVHFKWIYCLII